MAKQHQIITDLDEFKRNCSTFVTDILISDFEYSEDPIEYGGDYNTFEECALSSCHHKHRKGFIIKTKCGRYFNIGQDCGKTHLGANFKEWTEGVFAQFRAVSQRVKLAREPIEFLKEFKRESANLRKMEKANNFIWDYLAPLAQEAARRKNEIKLRGLSFIANRLSISSVLDEMEREIKSIIQAAEHRDLLAEEERVLLLSKLRGLRTKLRNMRSAVEIPCAAFFGSEVGLGPAERGANLERIKAAFSSTSRIPTIDVTRFPESIYIPSMHRRVSAYGVFQV